MDLIVRVGHTGDSEIFSSLVLVNVISLVIMQAQMLHGMCPLGIRVYMVVLVVFRFFAQPQIYVT